MGNLLDYLYWRGDLSFNKDGFNKIDALAFSQLTLIDFSKVIPLDMEKISLREALEKYLSLGNKLTDPLGLVISNRVHTLFEMMANSERYKNVLLFNYKRIFNKQKLIQFSAFTASLGHDNYLISYGGTDDSIVGWLEDLSLIYEKPLAGQEIAKDYYNDIFQKTGGQYFLVGHSKGANLVMFTTLFADDDAFSGIKKSYNFDGPGFSLSQMNDYKNLKERWRKIVEYMPERGTIGRLFYHAEKYYLVSCDADVVYQHDVFNWNIKGANFIYASVFGDEAIFLDYYFKEVVDNLSMDDRRLLIISLQKTAKLMNVTTLTEVRKNLSRFVGSLFKLKKEERAIINSIFLKKFMRNPKISKMLSNVIFKKRTFKLNEKEKAIIKIESQIDEDDLLIPDDLS